MNKTILLQNLGCRLNIAESDAIAAQFLSAGYRLLPQQTRLNDMNPDVVIINPCTVTAQADRKSRNLIRRAKAPIIIATGCYITSEQKSNPIFSDVDYFVDNSRKSKIFDIVEAHISGEIINLESLDQNPFGYFSGIQPLHTRAFIKIQDGCDNHCSFCIIPEVRGNAVSRPVPDIIKEIHKLIELGHVELVLTGVNIGRYQWEKWNFSKLLNAILEIPGEFRIRISSLEPDPIDEQFYELLQNKKLCPHFHICLQSGSDRILLQMRREYQTDQYLEIITRIRHAWNQSNILGNLTTDIIVGFPGETDSDFAQTVSLCEKVNFGHIHTFRFSARSGTRAARLENIVTEKIKLERSKRIRSVSDNGKKYLSKKLSGKLQHVLVEEINNGIATGYCDSFSKVAFPADKTTLKGKLQKVRISSTNTNNSLDGIRA